MDIRYAQLSGYGKPMMAAEGAGNSYGGAEIFSGRIPSHGNPFTICLTW
jgi:hypothetical protein